MEFGTNYFDWGLAGAGLGEAMVIVIYLAVRKRAKNPETLTTVISVVLGVAAAAVCSQVFSGPESSGPLTAGALFMSAGPLIDLGSLVGGWIFGTLVGVPACAAVDRRWSKRSRANEGALSSESSNKTPRP
jgi:hypothetical protein